MSVDVGTTAGVGTPCGSTAPPPLASAQARERADLFKALADPVRLQLLSIIAASSGCEACVCDMTDRVEVSQPTVSHHLKVLVDAGLLHRERRGSWAWFRLDPARTDEIRGYLRG